MEYSSLVASPRATSILTRIGYRWVAQCRRQRCTAKSIGTKINRPWRRRLPYSTWSIASTEEVKVGNTWMVRVSVTGPMFSTYGTPEQKKSKFDLTAFVIRSSPINSTPFSQGCSWQSSVRAPFNSSAPKSPLQ